MIANQSPFQQMKPPTSGPSITPASMNGTQRGGQQNPPYLQMRRPTPSGLPGASQPVVTPKPAAPGDTVSMGKSPNAPTPVAQPPMTPGGLGAGQQAPANAPAITPAGAKPVQAGGNTLGDVYSFMKSDLQNQAKQAKSGAVADASARGVYYGTPLTGSEADIDTQYLRGVGQLDTGMYANEQQNQLSRLGMATNLSAMGSLNAPPQPGPMDFSGLGALFGNSNPTPPGPVNPNTSQRNGPVVTPAKQPTPPYQPYGV